MNPRFAAPWALLAGCLALAAATSARADEPADLEKVLQAEAERVAVVEKAKQAVLAIFGRGGGGGGSGVVISPDGYALSNFHVTKGAGDAMKCGMSDGRLYDAVIVGIDPTGDVALIKLFGRDDFPHAEIGDSDTVEVGNHCFAMGNPFLLATDFQPTVTYGIVSGVHRYQYPAGSILEYADCIQTDASINPGNSGGPLFNAEGQLVGINGRGSFEKRGRVNVGVGYAISINQIMNFLGYLKSGRIVDHATLGARVSSDEDGSVVVADILESSDAFRRGLRYDDEIVSFGGRRIRTVNQFKNVLGIFPKGWRVPLSYRRDGEVYDVLVRLMGLHRTGELEKLVGGGPQPHPMPQPDDEKPDDEKPEGDEPDDGKPEDETPDGDGEGEDGEEKPGEEPKPIPIQLPFQRKAPMPKIVKEHYEKKHGYANYYFNKLNQDRVWKAFEALGDFSGELGAWTIEGETIDGQPIEFKLGDVTCESKLPLGDSRIDVTGELISRTDPPGSGGLLTTLYLWRRLLLVGPEKFGDLYYLGTAPWPGQDQLLDVLVGSFGGVECRFLFDPDDGKLRALEMFTQLDMDPCEVDFKEYGEVDGRLLPRRIEVRNGDRVFGSYKTTGYTFGEAEEE